MKHKHYLSLISVIFLTACATQSGNDNRLEKSFLASDNARTEVDGAELVNDKATTQDKKQQERFRFVPPLKLNTYQTSDAEDVLSRFNDKKEITIASDELPLKDFLHQVFGKQLNISYILADEINNDKQAVSLNLQKAITERKLFTLTEELLSERGYIIRVDDNIFYIHKTAGKGHSGNLVYGYGKNIDDVPTTSLEIMQMVPFEYGMQTTLANTLRQLLGVKVVPDSVRNSLIIQGKRKKILQALELIHLMDKPTLQNRQIGVFSSTFMPTDDLIKKLTEILKQEGISLSGNSSSALSVVQLEQQGEILFFANNMQIIERAVFWAKQIDKPVQMAQKQYFIYQPQYSRAVDMGDSLEALIGGASSQPLSNSVSAGQENRSGSSLSSVRSASSKDMKMVIDQRANALIFHTSGEGYQQILPLIKRLDILPKQIMLEVMIAEVTLLDEFKLGVEFAFQNGNYGISTAGALMGEGFGGLAYTLSGVNGNIALNMLQSNSLVNVLSRPSLVVRDGVNAKISVGTDIPIIGETTSDPISGDKQTTKIEYRKTGVELSVTPTVNAQGIIIMEIQQNISNQVDAGSTAATSPSVFERTLSTEVVAESGQTIILGGLISETRSEKETKVPFFGDLPFIGGLFRAQTDSGDKTELVIFVTPRLIESNDEWAEIKERFAQGLSKIKLNRAGTVGFE